MNSTYVSSCLGEGLEVSPRRTGWKGICRGGSASQGRAAGRRLTGGCECNCFSDPTGTEGCRYKAICWALHLGCHSNVLHIHQRGHKANDQVDPVM